MSSSPPRLRRSPPRKPLHERSDSQNNEQARPTLRIIGDPEAHIYSSTPFPTHPSHILSPKLSRNHVSPGGSGGSRVSDMDPPTPNFEHSVDASASSAEQNRTLAPHAQDSKNEHSEQNDTKGLWRPMESYQPTQPGADDVSVDEDSMLDVILERRGNGQSTDDDASSSEDIVALPPVPSAASTPGHAPATPDIKLPTGPLPNDPNYSNRSVSSAGSSGTVVRTKVRDRPTRASYSAFPSPLRPTSSKSNSSRGSFSTPIKPKKVPEPVSPVSPASPYSLGSLSNQSNPDLNVLPLSLHKRSQTQLSVNAGPSIQYSTIRPPTASGSFAEISNVPQRPPKAHDQTPRWNPHLSTVESEGTDEMLSAGPWSPRYSGHPSLSSHPPHESPSSAPISRFSVPRNRSPQRDITNTSTIRVVEEESDDRLLALPPIPSSQGSSDPLSVSRQSSKKSRKRKSRPDLHHTRRSSKGSFFANSIPTWARHYYSRSRQHIPTPRDTSNESSEPNVDAPTESSLPPQSSAHSAAQSNASRPPTSSSRPKTGSSKKSRSPSIFRPRNRPRGFGSHRRTRSIPINRISPDEINVVEVRGSQRPMRKPSSVWSPHLWHDRRGNRVRRSVFMAPSLDEKAEGRGLGKRNIQIWLFAGGFIVPPGKSFRPHLTQVPSANAHDADRTTTAWFLASFLPLPPRPLLNAKGKSSTAMPMPRHEHHPSLTRHSTTLPRGPLTPGLQLPPDNQLRRATIYDRYIGTSGGKRVSRDMEKDLEAALAPVDEARYENARWWRNLNRVMCLLGVALVALVITLGVVGSEYNRRH